MWILFLLIWNICFKKHFKLFEPQPGVCSIRACRYNVLNQGAGRTLQVCHRDQTKISTPISTLYYNVRRLKNEKKSLEILTNPAVGHDRSFSWYKIRFILGRIVLRHQLRQLKTLIKLPITLLFIIYCFIHN